MPTPHHVESPKELGAGMPTEFVDEMLNPLAWKLSLVSSLYLIQINTMAIRQAACHIYNFSWMDKLIFLLHTKPANSSRP